MRKNELLGLLAPAPGLSSLRKPHLIALLAEQQPDPRPFRHWYPQHQTTLLSLRVGDLCERLRLMFFGNLSQGWEEFVLAQLGVFRYEQVPLTPDSRGFHCREDIDYYRHLHQCRQALEASLPTIEAVALLGDNRPDNPWLRSRQMRLEFALARQLEREEHLDAALMLYQRSGWKGARQRQIRILEKRQQYSPTYRLVEAALANPEDEAELQLVSRAQRRLARKLGHPVLPAPADTDNGLIELALPGPHPLGVELAVCEHLSSDEAPVHFVENSLITGLFGLLCWEAIFAPLPGAFFHPFHSAPVDLHSADFYQRRQQYFSDCLALLESDSYRQRIRHNWQQKQGIQTPFINWAMLSEELLDQALHCLPARHLQLWFQRLLTDLRSHRAGMPDLIQFWPAEQRYRMIEVKGPGDRLQDNQRRWLRFCAQHGMPVEVCYVQWSN
ncbi:MAG: VRR-NUC domain-containing protein [Pseudomonas sp.]